MSLPIRLPRPIALLLGIVMVCGASALVTDAVMRTALVWAGIVPILWALHGIWTRQALREAASVITAPEAKPAPAVSSRPATAAQSRPASPASPASPAFPASPKPSAPAMPQARPASAPRAQADRAAGPASQTAAGDAERQFLGLRRLTEQYLKEVRRMNLIATWGREGTIDRKQALDEIRQIEERMRNLTEKMKFVAGKSDV